MPDPAPPGIAQDAVDHRAQTLTPEAIEAILADFRTWLEQVPRTAPVPPPTESAAPIDLHTLLSQFIALRHEVNLQTRAVRAQQEQNAQTLQQLTEALELLEEQQPAEPQPSNNDGPVRALLKTLIDLYDALALAQRELLRVQDTILPYLDQLAGTMKSPPERNRGVATPSFWSRWLQGGREGEEAERPKQQQTREVAAQVHAFLDSVITGYTMSLQRLERALQQHGLEAIPAVGHSFDPERMEVLDVATNSGRPANEVVEEVRRGYLWQGRVFRYAQVRVAKS